MFPSLALMLAFTVVFTATGLRSLVGLFAGGDRTGEVSHLLMSVAMVGMTWGLTGGPGSPVGVAQLVVFGLLGLVFAVRLLDPGERPRVGDGYHLLMLAAMVWMVSAMSRLMGMSADPASMPAAMPASHGHHAPGAAPAWWLPAITVAFVVLLCAAALAPVVQSLRRAPVLVRAAAPQRAGSGACSRLDTASRVLMTGGMAAALLAML